MIYIYSFLAALTLSLIFTPLVRKFCIKKNIALPKIRSRDVHKTQIPRLGGVAISLSFFLVVMLILIFTPVKLFFVSDKFLGIDKNLFGLLLAGVTWIVVGIYDDIKDIKPWTKFIWQGICGLIIVTFGIKIWWLSNPIGGLNLDIGWMTYLLVPIWVGLLMNALNWFDGIDGLTPGISLISLLVLFFLSIKPEVNQPATALLCIILAGSVLGFLPYNWNPAKIFLGDSGSMFLGLMIAVFSIISGAKLATAALVLGVPIIDAFWVIFKRISVGKSPWHADRNHLHHQFLDAGFSQKQTALIIYTISAGFGIVALSSSTKGKFIAGGILLILMLILAMVLYFMTKNKTKGKI